MLFLVVSPRSFGEDEANLIHINFTRWVARYPPTHLRTSTKNCWPFPVMLMDHTFISKSTGPCRSKKDWDPWFRGEKRLVINWNESPNQSFPSPEEPIIFGFQIGWCLEFDDQTSWGSFGEGTSTLCMFFFCCYGNWRIRLGHSLKDRGRFFVCSGFTSLQPDKVRLRFSFQEPAVTEPKFSGTFFP